MTLSAAADYMMVARLFVLSSFFSINISFAFLQTTKEPVSDFE
jgi:hypothetical protein